MKDYAQDFDQTCKLVFNTESGMRLLGLMKYITEMPGFKPTVEETYYEMGKRDFVQSLINQVNDKTIIDDISNNLEAHYE